MGCQNPRPSLRERPICGHDTNSGAPQANLSERLRRAVDLEHWAAFNRSFEQVCDWLRSVAQGVDGVAPPSSVLLLGGDVHYSSISEVDLGCEQRSRVHQLICSPFRNPLSTTERRAVRVAASRAAARVFAKLAEWAGVDRPSATWQPLRRPTFENAISELTLDGMNARVIVRRSPREGEDPERLVAEAEVVLAGSPPS